jgi:hypothetical protein
MLVIEHDSGVLRALEAWFDSGELLAFREALRDAYECQQNPGAPLQTAEDESAGEALTAHPPNDLKLCPYCAEEIKTAAIFCKHCRTPLDNSPEANA